MNYEKKVKSFTLDVSGYLILLVQQIPGIWVWAPLMAAPVLLLLSALVSNLPSNMIEVVRDLFRLNEVFIGKVLIIVSIAVIVLSVTYLRMKKRNGLVISGPYKFIRHPQYTGFLLLTIGFTGWSYFYITNFFGIGWLSADQTIALWFLELFLYIILSFIEEKHLEEKFGEEYRQYRAKTPRFIPFLKTGKMDLFVSIVVFSSVLYIAIL